jgi:hypothetical protein
MSSVARIISDCRDGRKIARGVTSVTGSATNIATGLSEVEDVIVSLKRSAAPGLEVSLVTWAAGAAAGQINLYCWKPTAANDCTLIAATVAQNVEWLAIGK